MAQFNLRNIPNDLHRDFKTACAHYGINQRETFLNHMQAVVWDYKRMINEPNKLSVFKREGGNK